MNKSIKLFWKNNQSFILFIALMLVFRGAVADWYVVPTGSMKPTIVEGDRIFVNKMAYDVRLPFTHLSVFKTGQPQYNDIIVFDSVASGKKLVKRVIGTPGDIVAMNNNKLTINGQPLQYAIVAKSNANNSTNNTDVNTHLEQTAQSQHYIYVETPGSVLQTFSEVKVPQGHYLVLGDNRDNSADSRVIGFVPEEEILGKANNVIASLNEQNYYLPRTERFFKAL